MEPKIDLEKLLNDGAIIRIKPQGYSMYPLFIPGRDEALIQQIPIGYLRRNDVVLYRRAHSILVLHRIYAVTPAGFFMVGDNQSELEGPIQPEQIKGKLIAFIHNGKEISVNNIPYQILSFLWLWSPDPPVLLQIKRFFAKIKAESLSLLTAARLLLHLRRLHPALLYTLLPLTEPVAL